MLLDSNVLIAYFEGDPVAVSFVLANQAQRQPLFVSLISVTEMLSLRTLTDNEVRRINDFFEEFVILPFDRRTAEMPADFGGRINWLCRMPFLQQLQNSTIFPLSLATKYLPR